MNRGFIVLLLCFLALMGCSFGTKISQPAKESIISQESSEESLSEWYSSESQNQTAEETAQIITDEAEKDETSLAETSSEVTATEAETVSPPQEMKDYHIPDTVREGKNTEIPRFYGLKHEQPSQVQEAYLMEILDQVMISVLDWGTADVDVNDLFIMAPFTPYYIEGNEIVSHKGQSLLFPIASNGRVICVLDMFDTDEYGITYNIVSAYTDLLNEICFDNEDRRLLIISGAEDEPPYITLLLPEDNAVHGTESNVYLNLSGKYQK